MSIQDWKYNAAELRDSLRGLASGQAGAAENLAVVRAKLMPLFPRLIEYCRGEPADTARFTRDQTFLKELAHRMAIRETTILALSEGLRSLSAEERE